MVELTLIGAVYFWPLFQSRHSLEALPRGTGCVLVMALIAERLQNIDMDLVALFSCINKPSFVAGVYFVHEI